MNFRAILTFFCFATGSVLPVLEVQAAPLNLPAEGRFTVLNGTVTDALHQFCAALRLRVDVDHNLSQNIRRGFTADTPRAFLDTLAAAYNFDWYFDGQVLHVTPEQLTRDQDLPLDGGAYDVLVRDLAAQKISDSRYPIHLSGDGKHVHVFGPPRLIEIVTQELASLERTHDKSVTIYRADSVEHVSVP
ncbi:hypothetical protein J2D73_11630 [Acetobacter sacchari]|uniref:Uncharacterized protein n=1 Tax=Acetobacter sacchari TaxID=2661687 RepID=A0ABS3LX21_9PROT|nr:hypothetical protein [Acetobacter sacchari]MBO1360438.1 hypothetical protein [Acetobacter sacchari]